MNKYQKALVNRVIANITDHPKYFTISVYFQGCDATPKCPNCHNPETWDFDSSMTVNYEDLYSAIKKNIDLYLAEFPAIALALLGGEPLTEINRYIVYRLTKDIKNKYGNRVIIILYSWRDIEDLKKENLFEFIGFVDEFVLGRYEEELKTDSFPSSSNQKYITKAELRTLLYTN
ncbi:MAG TPA: radical SAM protein [Candidatus Atribacteria bacterium]|nr:radical SAM protein [Candidatus Atribacteria bacterium]